VPVAQPPRPAVPPAPPKPPEPPPKPKPEEVLAAFRELKPHQIDDKSLASLLSLDEGLETITELNLQHSPVTSGQLSDIGKLTQLTKLDVRNTAIDKTAAEAIARLTNLEELHIDGAGFDRAALEALRPLTNLRLLDMRSARLTTAGYAELLYHRKLVELVLHHSNVDDEALGLLADLPELERLHVSHTLVTDEGIARLSKLDTLVLLDLSHCPSVSGRAFAQIAKSKGLKSLRQLKLEMTGLNELGANAIRQMKNLELLDLSSTSTMQDIHLAQIVRGLDELRELNLKHCSLLTSNAMLAVKGHKNLTRLDLSYCPRIDDSVFNHLVTCKGLKWLNLANTNCSATNTERFKQFAPECEVVGVGLQATAPSSL